MVGSRLTGLEFRWFGKGQLLATRYQDGGGIGLEPSVAALIAECRRDAIASVGGQESLLRVAARLSLDADATNVADAEPDLSFTGRRAVRRVAALRCLAAGFAATANEVAVGSRDR